MGTLVLMRHAESEWNAKGLFAGWADVRLAPNGLQEAEAPCGVQSARTGGWRRMALKQAKNIAVTPVYAGVTARGI